ncbi:MAG TPA: hypothetical protein VEB68_04915 [Croceibacterium sp.]|nr:hypothetical protein [Croceibacterium sp.]
MPSLRTLLAAFALASAATGWAQAQPVAAAPGATFADMADLAERATIVALVEVRDQAVVEPERAPGLAAGHARLYIEARTAALLASRAPLGESLTYLADVPLTAKGKAPKLKKQRFLVFADPVPGRPGALQLVGPPIPATPGSEQLARTVIAAFASPDARPGITGVRDVMSVPGNLVGESETQLFLDTATGEPVSLTVVRRPGMEPQWGVSWSEIVDQSARPPAPETVEWYRLACFLPAQLPADAFLQRDSASRRRAEADYAFIREQLGECPRTLG